MSEALGARIHLSVTPTPADVERARVVLTRESCPRRYCWYWHTLAFDWDLSPEQGCEVAERHMHRLLLQRQSGEPVPAWQECCRASGNTQHTDYHEPREPHLEADGWPEDFFVVVGKTAGRRRYERRHSGKRRRETE
ncbi:MAG: hypothetical protein HY040_03040 [Planctomycetes bacterium]|nr:hypothetical protein [Planctomycetota bacterium]